jgi:hypothetical protein
VKDQGGLDGDASIDLFCLQSAESRPGSYSCTGWAGMMVEMACL